jgi:hypothetical protein
MDVKSLEDEIDAIDCEPPNLIPQMIHGFTTNSKFDISQETRERLLDRPNMLLVISHTCEDFDHEHQRTVAMGTVSADRMRQMSEQAMDSQRPFAIEFPTAALIASSPSFKSFYEVQPGLRKILVSTGNILPGYVMCVLDWYARALQSKSWYEFLPEAASIEGDDKWYWVYCYAAMRLLDMHESASRLQVFLETFIDALTADSASYGHLLRSLQPHDPLILKIASSTAKDMQARSINLTQADCQALAEHFPEFAASVNAVLREINSNEAK